MKSVFCLFVLVLMTVVAFSQPFCGGRPMSVRKAMPVLREVCQLPSRQQLAKCDFGGFSGNADAFAVPLATDLNPCNSGQWETVDDKRVWRLAISSPNAYSLNLTFSDFVLPPGAELFLYNSDTTQIVGAFSSDNNAEVLPTIPIVGDVVYVEYVEPADVEFQGFFNIVQVAHDFKGAFSADTASLSECQVDVNSELGADWQDEKRAVCRILVNGTTLCTGTLLNTANQSFEPYVLTARHCISSERQAQNSIFYFNYEDEQSEKQYVAGSTLVASKDNDNGYLDFALVRLADVPAEYNAYYAGWYVGDSQLDMGVCIHHPNGNAKMLAVDFDSLRVASYRYFDKETFWNVAEWDVGTTEQGSSGAPLFNSDHKVVGILAGGDADCSYPMNDYFQMLSVCYDRYDFDSLQLAHWLNPEGKPLTSVSGACRPTGIELESSPAQIGICPNPAQSHVEISAEKPIGYVSICTMHGNAVMRFDAKARQTVTIDIANLRQGLYVCQVFFADGYFANSVIVKE